jgi:hypothetical protein
MIRRLRPWIQGLPPVERRMRRARRLLHQHLGTALGRCRRLRSRPARALLGERRTLPHPADRHPFPAERGAVIGRSGYGAAIERRQAAYNSDPGAPDSRISARPVRGFGASRRRRNGRGLPGAGRAVEAGRRDQGAARVLLTGRGPAAALRAGGAGRGRLESPGGQPTGGACSSVTGGESSPREFSAWTPRRGAGRSGRSSCRPMRRASGGSNPAR